MNHRAIYEISSSSFCCSFFVTGCSSSGEDASINVLDEDVDSNQFIGSWILNNYILDDGTMRTVPVGIQNEGGIGLFVLSDESFIVASALCESYEISFRLDNDVLSTSNPIFPEEGCDASYIDEDNAERSELLTFTFLNTQTLIVLSSDVLSVTTMENETLNFRRLVM